MQKIQEQPDGAALPADQRALPKGMADELDLTDLVAEFVATLPGKVAALRTALVEEDCDRLAHLVGELRHSSDRYGFPLITQAAQVVEAHAKAGECLEGLGRDIAALAELCCWVRHQAVTDSATAPNATARTIGQCGRQSRRGAPENR